MERVRCRGDISDKRVHRPHKVGQFPYCLLHRMDDLSISTDRNRRWISADQLDPNGMEGSGFTVRSTRSTLINLMTSLLGCYVPSTHDLRHKPLVSFVEPNRGQPQQTRTWIVSKNTRTTSRDCATCCCRDFAHAIAGLRLIVFYFHSSFQIPRRNTFLIYVHLNVSTSPRCILSPSSISHGHVSCAPPLDSIQSYGH